MKFTAVSILNTILSILDFGISTLHAAKILYKSIAPPFLPDNYMTRKKMDKLFIINYIFFQERRKTARPID
jgi:hypothetical protein